MGGCGGCVCAHPRLGHRLGDRRCTGMVGHFESQKKKDVDDSGDCGFACRDKVCGGGAEGEIGGQQVGAVGRQAGAGRGRDARGADRALPRLTMEAGPSGDFAAPCRRNAPRYGAVEEARVGGTTAGQGMKRAARGRQSRTSRGQEASATAEVAG